jgi:hypothetical protein
MLSLSKSAIDVPDVESAAVDAVAKGRVYVTDYVDGDLTPVVPGGKRVVLETVGGRVELLTTQTYDGSPGAPGTYLNQADYSVGPDFSDPKLRLYVFGDFLRKVFSVPGALVWAPALIGLLVAGVGLWFTFAGQSPTSATTVADRGEAAIRWAVAPLAALPGDAGPAKVRRARAKVDRRTQAAARCLRRLRGAEAVAPKIPGVKCEPKKVDALHDKDNQPLIAVVLGFLAAGVGGVAARRKFGFQRSPSA